MKNVFNVSVSKPSSKYSNSILSVLTSVLMSYSVSTLASENLKLASVTEDQLALLLPLPKNKKELESLPSLNLLQYLDSSFFSSLKVDPEKTQGISDENELKSLFKIVGIRFDPCKKRLSSDSCVKQLRLIWQPIVLESLSLPSHYTERKSEPTTLDVALHTFHPLTEKQWDEFLKITESLKLASTSSVIHPYFKKYGFLNENSKQFFNTIESVLKNNQNSEIAIQKMMNRFESHWGFQHFTIDQTQSPTIASIPRINQTLQSFENWGMEHSILSDWLPFQPLQFGGSAFMLNSLYYKLEYIYDEKEKPRFLEERKNLFSSLEKLMNASKTPFHGDIDCVSCHVAPAAHSVLVGDQKVSTKSLRLFGYNKSTPVFSERVRSEVRENLKFLKK